jgi:hypothetical protein
VDQSGSVCPRFISFLAVPSGAIKREEPRFFEIDIYLIGQEALSGI